MKKAVLSIALVAMVLTAVPARADYTLDFGVVSTSTSSISYGNGAKPLIGTGLSVTSLTGLGTPLYDFISFGVQSGALNFTTGAYAGGSSGTWNFGPGGSLSITGGISSLGIAAGTTLLTGTFSSVQVTSFGTTFKIAGASFTDSVNAALASAYGLGAYNGLPWDGNFSLSFMASTSGRKFSSSQVLGGDVYTHVPEPGGMLLLGTGLFGLAGILRRRPRSK